VNSAKVDIEHRYYLLAVEVQRLHIELGKLHGVVTEFQEQIEISRDECDLTSLPPAAVIDMYIRDVLRIVSELDDTNFDDVDHESLAATTVALQQENESLRCRIDQVQSEKKDLEKQLVCVEELIVLARELKDENQGLIRDFKGLKDSIVVEQQNDALEIVELTKSFKELIADNEILRRQNEQRQIELAASDVHQFASSGEVQEHIDSMVDCDQLLDKSALPLVVAKSSQATSDQDVQTEEPLVEVDDQMAKLWKQKTMDTETQTEIDMDLQTTVVPQSKTTEDKMSCSMVTELMNDVRRKNEEISRLHQNLERMDHVLSEVTKKTSDANKAIRESTCPASEDQNVVSGQQATSSVGTVQSTTGDNDHPDAERDKSCKETMNTKTEVFKTLPECESVSAGKWMSRQTSTDSGVSRGRSFECSRDHDSYMVESSLQSSSLNLQSQPADTVTVELSSSAWDQLVAENRCLHIELAKLTAPKGTLGGDERADDLGPTASLQQHAAELESEIVALKRTVKEQSVYLVTPGVYPDSNDASWAQPYDHNSPITDKEEENKLDDQDNGQGSVDALRCENALLSEQLEAIKFQWNEYEASVNETANQLQEETVRLHDQQCTILYELAAKTTQVEELEELSRQQTAVLQRTVDEVTDKYWSVLDDVDSRRPRLNNNCDFNPGDLKSERTVQDFGRRLEGWLKDYQALIRERNARRMKGDVVPLYSIPEDQPPEDMDAEMRFSQPDSYEKLMSDMSNHLESVDREIADLQIPLEQTQLTVDALVTKMEQLGSELEESGWQAKTNNEEADRSRTKTHLERTQLTVDTLWANLDQLKAELKAKEEEVGRKNEEIDQIRVENEALQVATSSPSPLITSDYEEQLVSEIERLTFDRSMLQQRLQEAEFEVQETREELISDNELLRRQLHALERRLEDDKTSADKNAELLMAENRHLREHLSQREADFRAAEESHSTHQAESADRLRSMEEKVMLENGRLHSELAVVTAERSQLRENCAKLESDCLAFQELSNEMIEHCKRLSIELERLRRSTSRGGSASASHVHHEDCQRTAEQAHRQVQALKDENSRLTMTLEMERLKNFAEEHRVTIDSQTDTDDLRPGVTQSAFSVDGERLRLNGAVEVSAAEGDVRTGKDAMMSLLLGQARTARSTALRLRHLLNTRGCRQNEGKAQIGNVVEEEQLTDESVGSYQLAEVVDKLVVELDALAITDGKEMTTSLPEKCSDGNNHVDYNTSANHKQLLELQQLLQVNSVA